MSSTRIPPSPPAKPASHPPAPEPTPGEPVDAVDAVDPALFDAIPADAPRPESGLRRVLALIADTLSRAASHIRQALGLARIPSMDRSRALDHVQVTAPFNVKKHEQAEWPQELLAEWRALERDRAAAEQQQAFVSGADLAAMTPPPSDDERAFQFYLAARRQRKGDGERVLCAQNFIPGAKRVATEVLALEKQRRESMADAGKAYWLAPDDQERLEAAAALLASDEDVATRARAKEVIDAGPVQPLSVEQALSFHAWRDWRRNPDKLPPEENFSLEAALAYAQLQVQVHARREMLKENQELMDLLADASDLIAHQDHYGAQLAGARALGTLQELRDLHKKQASELKQDPVASTALPPAPPPPPPRARATAQAMPQSISEELGLPPMSRLSPEDIMRAHELFDQFTQEFSRSPQEVRVQRDSPYLFPACVAVANDYAERITASADLKPSPAQLTKLQAALKLRELYNQYRKSVPKS